MTRPTTPPVPLGSAKPADAAQPLLWDFPETCRQLSISRRTAERLISAGKFVKPVRIGRSIRFRSADVLMWLDEQANGKGGALVNEPTPDKTLALVTPATAANLFGVPILKIKAWIADGRVSVSKVRSNTYISLDDVERLAREGTNNGQ